MKDFFKKYKDYLLKKLALPTLIIVWAASYYIEVMGYSVTNHRMIQPIFWVMVALYLINAYTDLREYKREISEKPADEAKTEESAESKQQKKTQTVRIIAVMVCMALYALLLNSIGFIVTTFAFAIGVLLIMGERKWCKILLLAIVLTVGLYVAFDIGLKIPLPAGVLGF